PKTLGRRRRSRSSPPGTVPVGGSAPAEPLACFPPQGYGFRHPRDREARVKKIVIFGATSAIAQACARIWAGRKDALFLVGRNAERLEAVAADLKVRGASRVEFLAHDLADLEAHERLVARADEALGGVDVALVAHGTLGDQTLLRQDVSMAVEAIGVNFVSAASLLSHLANLM